MSAFEEYLKAIYNSLRLILIYSGKGGSGKTTLGQNLAWWLASLGRTVVLVDTDSRAMSSNFINMFAIPERERYTLSHVIQDEVPLLQSMYQVRRGLYIIPSDSNIDRANNHIVTNEAQEIMIDRFNDMARTLAERMSRWASPPTGTVDWHQEQSISLRDIRPAEPVSGDEVRLPPSQINYLIWDFAADPGPLGKAILRIPRSEILAPVVLEPLPLLAFAQMKIFVQTLFKNHPEQMPTIKGVVPYHLTHKKEFTSQEFVKLYLAHPEVFMRAVHEDLSVPETQRVYPAQSIYEGNRQSRAAREILEIALRVDGYQGLLKGGPACKYCNEIHDWLQQQHQVAG